MNYTSYLYLLLYPYHTCLKMVWNKHLEFDAQCLRPYGFPLSCVWTKFLLTVVLHNLLRWWLNQSSCKI